MDSLSENIELNAETMSYIENLNEMVNDNQLEVSLEMAKKMVEIADKQMDKILSGDLPASPEALKVTNLALNMKIKQ